MRISSGTVAPLITEGVKCGRNPCRCIRSSCGLWLQRRRLLLTDRQRDRAGLPSALHTLCIWTEKSGTGRVQQRLQTLLADTESLRLVLDVEYIVCDEMLIGRGVSTCSQSRN